MTFLWFLQTIVVLLPGFPKTWVKRLLQVNNRDLTSSIAWIALDKYEWSEVEFRELVRDARVSFRRSFSLSQKISASFLDILLDDEDYSVRSGALENPNVDWDEVRRRFHAGEDMNLSSVLFNPCVPLDFVVLFASEPELKTHPARERFYAMDDEEFAGKLSEIGREELVGLPRDWVLRVLV